MVVLSYASLSRLGCALVFKTVSRSSATGPRCVFDSSINPCVITSCFHTTLSSRHVNFFDLTIVTAIRAFGIESVIRELKKDLGTGPEKLLCEAIRSSDKKLVRKTQTHLSGLSLLAPKNEAILAGRPNLLIVLLKRDSRIETKIVTTACERVDHKSIYRLLNYGWPMNEPCVFRSLRTLVGRKLFMFEGPKCSSY